MPKKTATVALPLSNESSDPDVSLYSSNSPNGSFPKAVGQNNRKSSGTEYIVKFRKKKKSNTTNNEGVGAAVAVGSGSRLSSQRSSVQGTSGRNSAFDDYDVHKKTATRASAVNPLMPLGSVGKFGPSSSSWYSTSVFYI